MLTKNDQIQFLFNIYLSDTSDVWGMTSDFSVISLQYQLIE